MVFRFRDEDLTLGDGPWSISVNFWFAIHKAQHFDVGLAAWVGMLDP